MKKSFPIYLIFLLAVLLLPGVLFAIDDELIHLQVPLGDLTKVKDLGDYIRNFYTLFVTSAGILAVVMIVLGGYMWITAAGNAQKISSAKETIISAILGLVLALTSYLILHTVNPSITALEPLVLPGLQPYAKEGVAQRLCDFDQEINGQTGKPVECGETIYVSAEEQCLGVYSSGGKKYCEVTDIGGMKMGVIKENKVAIADHPSGERSFDIFYTIECGDVYFEPTKSKYFVGNLCSEVEAPPGSGKKFRARCYLEGTVGIFEADPSVCTRPGCGRLTNMKCQP